MFSFVAENVDHVTLVAQASGVLLVSWFALYLFLYPLSRSLFASYFSPLTPYQKYEWCSRIVSTVHAMMAVGMALYTLFIEGELDKGTLPFAERMSVGVDITASITLSYWVYDLVLIGFHWKEHPDMAMLVHHLAGIIPFALGTYYREFMSFSPAIILTEISTPFVNARWFMATTKTTGSPLYAVNGLMMWLTFLFCRILWLPYGLRLIALNIVEYYAKYHWIVLIPVTIGTPVAYLLSCYWFLLITKGLIKVVFGRSSSSSSHSKPKAKKD